MKKKIIISIGIIVCVLLTVAFVCSGRKPYKTIDTSDIVSATVHLSPPDKTIEIEDVEKLISYLDDVVIYNKDNSYTKYVGQAVTFSLTMSDGSQEVITAYNPFIIINGTGYRTKYEPCEKLNSYANELLYQEN